VAAISFGSVDSWVVARWAFEQLLERTAEAITTRPEIQEELRIARANEHLDFALLPAEAGQLLAGALATAIAEIREVESTRNDELSRSWVTALAELERRIGEYARSR
jgi:hypothetical protein